jgi:hypothetical protein
MVDYIPVYLNRTINAFSTVPQKSNDMPIGYRNSNSNVIYPTSGTTDAQIQRIITSKSYGMDTINKSNYETPVIWGKTYSVASSVKNVKSYEMPKNNTLSWGLMQFTPAKMKERGMMVTNSSPNTTYPWGLMKFTPSMMMEREQAIINTRTSDTPRYRGQVYSDTGIPLYGKTMRKQRINKTTCKPTTTKRKVVKRTTRAKKR